ncbi:MAG: M24 family metallopeptidase [Alphaproteobacteria bacterium]|nr:M24 family metallopeptidase [Alphaproteobacteria bacterium]
MVELHPYPRFSIKERDRRWAAVRRKMREVGIDVIVVPNNTGHSTDFQANARYLTHVGGGGDSDVAAVFPLEGDVTAIATSAAPRWPCVQDWTDDVREANRAYGRATVERLKELKVDRGRIGIAGLGADTRTPEGTILYGFWKAVNDAFPHADFVDATDILRQVRIVKSEEEIEALIKSVEIIEKGVAAKIKAARPGAIDWEVWAAAICAMMHHGSELSVHYNWVSGKDPIRTLTRPTFRPLEVGDLIIDELEASWMGYRSQVVQPVYVGVADPLHEELIKIQREIFNAVVEQFKPGVSLRELMETAVKACKCASPPTGPTAGTTTTLTLHGRGAGDDGPIMVGNMRKSKDLDVLVQENMVCIFKPSAEIQRNGKKTICRWGDTVVAKANGGRRLGNLPHDLAVSAVE